MFVSLVDLELRGFFGYVLRVSSKVFIYYKGGYFCGVFLRNGIDGLEEC